MNTPFSKKTRRNYKKNNSYLDKKNTNAKKGAQLKCIAKTCRAKKYQSVYGASTGGKIRATRQLFY